MIRLLPSNEHLPLHYGMTIVAYPFFAAVAENIGRLLTLQESFTIEQIQRRMRESLGQRDTVKYATTRVVRSLAYPPGKAAKAACAAPSPGTAHDLTPDSVVSISPAIS